MDQHREDSERFELERADAMLKNLEKKAKAMENFKK